MFPQLLIALSALIAADIPPASLEQFLEQIAEKRAGVKTLRAEYQQQDLLPDETFSTEGTLLYLKPQRIIRQVQDPKSTILMDGRTGYLYEPEIKQLQIFAIEDDPQNDILFLGFDDDMRKLEQAYDVKLLQREQERGLLITPKFNPYKDPLFEEVSITFEEENLLPERIEIINEDGSKTIYTVTKFQINPPVDPAETQIALPEGTRIIHNDEGQKTEKVEAGGKLVPGPMKEAASIEPAAPEEPSIKVKSLEPLDPAGTPPPAGEKP